MFSISTILPTRSANREMGTQLKAFLDASETGRSLAAEIVSGGGTGSHLLDGESKLLTEVQAGSYVFMDEGYISVDIEGRRNEFSGRLCGSRYGRRPFIRGLCNHRWRQ